MGFINTYVQVLDRLEQHDIRTCADVLKSPELDLVEQAGVSCYRLRPIIDAAARVVAPAPLNVSRNF